MQTNRTLARAGLAATVALFCSAATLNAAPMGNLDAPAPPTDPASAMYTLDDIFYRLVFGSTGAKRTGAFTEPLNAPMPTGPTLNDVMGVAPHLDFSYGAGSDMVLAGHTYWGLTPGQWGYRFGTMPIGNLSALHANVTAGYYFATTLTSVDTDLVGSNIRNGVTIFGVEGTLAPAPVARTGQITSYISEGDGGSSAPGVEWPVPRFSLLPSLGNEVVRDNLTGLMWAQALPAGSSTFPWVNAVIYCTDYVTLGGFNDWRVPTRSEILSLVDLSRQNPAIPFGNPFNAYIGNYWSSSTYAPDANKAWMLDLSDGSAFSTYKGYGIGLLWPVRNAQ